jgi:hypothetical protein
MTVMTVMMMKIMTMIIVDEIFTSEQANFDPVGYVIVRWKT